MTAIQLTSAPHRTAIARHRAAAIVVILAAVGIAVGTVVAVDALRSYQVTANFVGAAAMVATAVFLLRGGGRKPAVILTWIAAFGIVAEAGDHQTVKNVTGALGATNTSYFLPGLTWLALAALFAAAVAVMILTKRVRGDA